MGKLWQLALFIIVTMLWWAMVISFVVNNHNALAAIALCIPCIVWANVEPHIEDEHDT